MGNEPKHRKTAACTARKMKALPFESLPSWFAGAKANAQYRGLFPNPARNSLAHGGRFTALAAMMDEPYPPAMRLPSYLRDKRRLVSYRFNNVSEGLLQARIVGVRQDRILQSPQITFKVAQIGGAAQHGAHGGMHGSKFIGCARYGIHVAMNEPIKGLALRHGVRGNESALLEVGNSLLQAV